ncbi:pilus assembly protein [Thalassotalea euphylliae]|uniref:Pilus assembly protein n=1 Tax=Thalassotalea euphylliae TaxID=1655234 RepID=A0A3E0TN30_9GAMM|nr:TadE family protein [Thalassotalea euphylliae]REL25956.1 pilus assembly protein [Thalassotalea euphylliae]
MTAWKFQQRGKQGFTICQQQRQQQGSVAIEVAIVLPLLLFVVISCFDFVRGLLIRVSLDHALAEASREVKLTAASASNFQQLLVSAMTNKQVISFTKSKLTVTQLGAYSSPTALANNQPSGAISAPLVSYQLDYQFQAISPWLRQVSFRSQVVVKHEN